MILRRLATHVREQNWTAIAIDFFIVVVGVFIDSGLQLERAAAGRPGRAGGVQPARCRSGAGALAANASITQSFYAAYVSPVASELDGYAERLGAYSRNPWNRSQFDTDP